MVTRFEHPWIRIATAGAGVRVEGTPSANCGHAAHYGRDAMPPGSLFLSWEWDGETLTAWNDRYGIYPAFYCGDADGVMLSPSLLQLLDLGAPRDLDTQAVAAFLRAGFYLGEDTPFVAIRQLPPGARLTWRAGVGVTVTGGEPIQVPSQMSFSEAADTFYEGLRVSLTRRAPQGRAVMALSGGRDSRFILLELLRQGHRVETVTTNKQPPYPTEDVPAAKAVAERLGVPWTFVESTEDLFEEERTKNLRGHLCVEEGGYFLRTAEFIGRHGDTTYDGYLGDVLSGIRFFESGQLDVLRAGRYDEVAQLMCAYRETQLKAVLSPEAYRRFDRDLGMQRIRQAVVEQAGKPNPIGSFLIWNRSRREVALQSLALIPPHVRVDFPYLDADLFDAMIGLPAELLLSGDLTVESLHRAFPEVSDLPFERAYPSKKRPLHPAFRTYGRRLLAELGRRNHPMLNVRQIRTDATKMAFLGVRMAHRNRQLVQYLMALQEWLP